ncbi:hypothetical protein OUZ56_005153 [Daphnia magna]|uniref:Uncharacterized protein n=1 Tax=Daphnia magna TaxID=35525 RepID=A0ABQ9YS67_9CRUS|nr:hypothetical protein OUZ56_005153 [Daphnia magna]
MMTPAPPGGCRKLKRKKRCAGGVCEMGVLRHRRLLITYTFRSPEKRPSPPPQQMPYSEKRLKKADKLTVAKEGEANESPNVIVEENAHERRLMMALCLPPPLHLVSTFTTFHSAEVDGTIGAAAMGTHTHTHREKKRKYKISN